MKLQFLNIKNKGGLKSEKEYFDEKDCWNLGGCIHSFWIRLCGSCKSEV